MSREGCCAGRRIRARGIISELHAARLLSARTGPPFERTRLCQRARLCQRTRARARGSGSGALQCRPALRGRGAEGQGREAGRGGRRGLSRRQAERRRASLRCRWGWLPSECDAAEVAAHRAHLSRRSRRAWSRPCKIIKIRFGTPLVSLESRVNRTRSKIENYSVVTISLTPVLSSGFS